MARAFRDDIQGLRAVAVLLVVLYHGGVTALSGGYSGVDVFFVISGFLITGHLFTEVSTTGRLQFGRFYARRARRILPASFAVLILSCLAAAVFLPPLQLEDEFPRMVATALYAPNLLFAWQGTDYLSETLPSFLQHYWSLGVEEQFYLVWPVVMLLLFWLLRRRRGALVVATAILVVGSFALSLWLTDRSQPWAFFSPATRAWEFGLGALVSFWLGSTTMPRPRRAGGSLLAWIGLAMIVVAGFALNQDVDFPGWAALLPAVGAALAILGGETESRWSPGRLLLRWRPVQFIGEVSYSMYLVHWPLLVIAAAVGGLAAPLSPWVSLGLAALSVPIAWLLYRYVEQPFRTRRFFVGRRPLVTLTAALAVSGVIVVLVAGGWLVERSRPLDVAKTAAPAGVEQAPIGTGYVPSNLSPGLRDASADVPVVYSNGCMKSLESLDTSPCWLGPEEGAPTVVLFGDSHAVQWYPALAQAAGAGLIRLGVFAHSGCPAALLDTAAATTPACLTWRSQVEQLVIAARPDLVLMGSSASGFASAIDAADRQRVWAAAQQAAIGGFTAAGLRVAVLMDTPRPGQTPAICLSAHLDDADVCDLPVSTAFDPRVTAADRSLGVPTIDMSGYLCDATTCPVIIGTHLVYRDDSHLTASMATFLAPEFDAAVLALVDTGQKP